MTSPTTLFKQGRKNEIWAKYCGFLDLDLEGFMEIQERLLLEQIEMLGKSMMGRMLMGDVIPRSVEEFRDIVPFTTYKDYLGYLDQKREDVLPRKPHAWVHTSGRSGEFKFKWAPYTQKMYDILGEAIIGSMILSNCTKRGEIDLELDDIVLLATAPPPLISGLIVHSIADHLDLQFLPPVEESDQMEFQERITEGFNLAMKKGVDYFYGIASILFRVGEKFEQGSSNTKFSMELLRPSILYRMIKGFILAKINHTPILPKYIWKLKGIMTGGTDTSIYIDQIEYYWGRKPLELFGSTEGGAIATQAWNYKGLTFLPEMCFLEFIPHNEHMKSKENPSYQPKTLLYDELDLGIYELVCTNFHGGIFTRYRVGDLIEVIALRDDEINVNLPQIRFYSRAGDIINLGGIALLTEKNIWEAIEGTNIDYYDWVARKEIRDNKPHLHLFLEVNSPKKLDKNKIQAQISQNLVHINPDYSGIEQMLGYDPLKISILNPGSFSAYMDYQQSQGADLAHTKPPHMKPTKEQMDALLRDKRILD
ncbi:MAG: GH3 auxin-responsive promoter family protein [Anaerolineales bacterium]|nr:GH3 auxin-responsive promoter family protein [Anaerolineales bacterium]